MCYNGEWHMSHDSHQANIVFPTHGLYLGEKFIFFSIRPREATHVQYCSLYSNYLFPFKTGKIEFHWRAAHTLICSRSLSLSQTHLTTSVHSPLLSVHNLIQNMIMCGRRDCCWILPAEKRPDAGRIPYIINPEYWGLSMSEREWYQLLFLSWRESPQLVVLLA